jgi:LacI family transcriptional regulator, repressor for deo operon, udp, cdd, tsx, nupC, and nupG
MSRWRRPQRPESYGEFVNAAELGRPARIKDVAARAGVSLKTVTNVVHERPYVKHETRQRVLAAITELNYRPSMIGRQLRSGRSNILTLAVPRIDEPYLGSLAHAIIAAATPRGYTVLIDETGGHPEHERQAAEGYPGHGIDGVIFSPLALDPEHVAAVSNQTPMVLLGEQLPGSPADYVAIDNEQSAREVVRHLFDGGRRQIGFLGGQPRRPTSVGALRLEGYLRQLDEAGIDPQPGWIAQTDRFTREAGSVLAARLRRDSPTLDALICASDLLAVGAIRALQQLGVRVPDDIAITGWDNIVDGLYSAPSLTTVAPDLAVLAERTLDALSRRIEGDRSPGGTFVVPHQLLIRESSAYAG